MNIVEVTWLDHTTSHGWNHDLAEPATVISVGYLAHETPDYYVLLSGWNNNMTDDDEDRYDCSHAIVKSTITNFQIIREDTEEAT